MELDLRIIFIIFFLILLSVLGIIILVVPEVNTFIQNISKPKETFVDGVSDSDCYGQTTFL